MVYHEALRRRFKWGFGESSRLERVAGIEPAYSAWKAAALPLSYTRGVRSVPTEWWRELDLNQRRRSQRIYSPSPLTTRASLHFSVGIKRPSISERSAFSAEARRPFGLRRVYDRPVSSCQHDPLEKVGKNTTAPARLPRSLDLRISRRGL